MKNLGAILAIGITAVIIIAVGAVNFSLAADTESSNAAEVLITEETTATDEETIAIEDAEAVRAAYEARETLLLAQIAELETELTDRQEAYDFQIEEFNGLFVTAEEQLSGLQNQESLLQEQIDQLLVAQNERAANYESQRQGAYYQYQVNIQQLQAQLDEGNVKLNEALTRLGQ